MRGLFLIFAAAGLTACNVDTGLSEPGASQPQLDQGVTDPNDPNIVTQGVIGLTPDAPKLPAGKVDDIDFKAYAPSLASHIGLIEGEARLDSIDKIRLYFAPEPGTNIANLTSSTFELDDGSVMIFARHAIPDDSVSAEEVYAVFSGPGGAEKFNQKLAAFGLRVKCRRGEKPEEWTTELCP